jgi:hypothetical protein
MKSMVSPSTKRPKVDYANLWRDAQKRRPPYAEAVEVECAFVALMLTPEERRLLAMLSPETRYVMGV